MILSRSIPIFLQNYTLSADLFPLLMPKWPSWMPFLVWMCIAASTQDGRHGMLPILH